MYEGVERDATELVVRRCFITIGGSLHKCNGDRVNRRASYSWLEARKPRQEVELRRSTVPLINRASELTKEKTETRCKYHNDAERDTRCMVDSLQPTGS